MAGYSTSFLQAIQVADSIAQRWSSNTNWSMWHIWDLLRHGYDAIKSPESFWRELYPYATCVGFAFPIADELSTAFNETKGLEQYSNQIQTLASWERDESNPNSTPKPRHCATAVFTSEACILIDLIYSPRVLVIPLGGTVSGMTYITMSGRRGQRLFHYSATPEGNILEMSSAKKDNPPKYPFKPTNHDDILRDLSIPSALRKVPNSSIPATKVVVIRGVISASPAHVPGIQLDADGGWMITTCRLQIDFWNRTLTMQLPLEDWLLKAENAMYQWVQEHEVFRKVDDGIAHLTVTLAAEREDEKTKGQVKVMREMGSALGLPAGEFDKIVESVYEVWE